MRKPWVGWSPALAQLEVMVSGLIQGALGLWAWAGHAKGRGEATAGTTWWGRQS